MNDKIKQNVSNWERVFKTWLNQILQKKKVKFIMKYKLTC